MQPTSHGKRWTVHPLFIGLAILTLLALGLSAVMFYRLANRHAAGVQRVGEIVQRLEGVDRLENLEADLIAPANEILMSRDGARERMRLTAAGLAFREHAQSLRRLLQAEPGHARSLGKLEKAIPLAAVVERGAQAAIDAFSQGDPAAASRALAAMNGVHVALFKTLQAGADDLREEERLFFGRQREEIARIGSEERALGIALGLVMAALFVYGWRLAREREANLDHFQERESQRESLVRERDEQARRLEEAQRVAGLGSWEWDVANNVVRWSAELHRIFGTSPEAFDPSYEAYLARVHPADRERMNRSVVASLTNRAPFEVEHRVNRSDGAVLSLNGRGNVECDAGGNVVRMYGIAHDITAIRAAEAELKRSEERFALAAQASNDVLWDWDTTANTMWVNDEWTRQYGHEKSGDIDIATWSEVVHPEDRPRVMASLQRMLQSNETVWIEESRFRAASGEERVVLSRGFVVRDDAGAPLRMIGAMMDITARKETEISMARLQRKTALILESAADGLTGLDLQGLATFVNPAAAHILGYQPHDLEGKLWHSIVHAKHEDGREFLWSDCLACKTLRDGQARRGNTMFWSREGKGIPVEFTTMAMLGEKGEVSGVVLTFRDISQRLMLDRMKDEFVSTVSHELRTPLTSIRGALGLLATGKLGVLTEKAARLLEIASSNTDRLVRLINDILDIERMESGKVTLTRVQTNAADLVRQATDMLRQPAEQARIALEVEASSIPLIADPDRIVQVLTNLIGNAIKFSPAQSRIRIRAEAGDGAVLFRVADQGRGIPSGKLETVFERFQQVDASDSRDKGGSGLGLAICRSIVRQHGGDISVTSEVGRGSEFTFSIPASIASIVPSPEETKRTERKVFICDDDADARDMMAALLTAHGYAVRQFDNGEDLLHAALHQHPDLILLDLFMPGMNGWEAMARLKGDARVTGIPVVVVSVLSPEEMESPYSDLCGWLHKPLEEGELLQAVTAAFASGEGRRTMLVVEDEADLAKVIAHSFERYGIDVVIASTGREAIDLAATLVPDVVILDLMLPEVDGFGVIDWVKDHNLWKGVPLVVYSALETTPSQQARLRLGPTEFITKSRIAPEEFERRVLHLLDRLTEFKAPEGRRQAREPWVTQG